MIKKVFYCAGDGMGCYGGLCIAANKKELEQELEPCCIKCGHYEEIETAHAKDGNYVLVAIKIDSQDNQLDI